jgi:hypothetical protein
MSGYVTPGISRHRLVSRLGSPRQPNKHKPSKRGPSKLRKPGLSTKAGVDHNLSLLLSLRATQRRTTSPPSQPRKEWGEVEHHQVRLLLSQQACPAHSTRTEGTAIPSVRTDTIPMPHCANKTAPPGGDDRYNDPPTKYAMTGWAHDYDLDFQGQSS